MEKNDREKENRVFEKTGTDVLGPALNGFVVWVLQNALESGKRRLYFLARDGYFMYKAAKIYAEKQSLPVECRYLSCSRYSLRLPMFHLDPEEALEYVCRDSIGLTRNRILGRAGLDREERDRVLEENGWTGKGEDPVRYMERKKIGEKLKCSHTFMEAMDRRSREALPPLAAYLFQEGLMDGAEAALVDSGWVGSMQKTLNRILGYLGRETGLEGYYWGLYELPPDVRREDYHCYYFRPEGTIREKVFFNNNLFETVFSAPHGMTMGYEEWGGQYSPVYAPFSDRRKEQMKNLERVLLGQIRRAADLAGDIRQTDWRRKRRELKPLLQRWMCSPTPEEAEVFGSMCFCDDVLEYGIRPLAEVMSEKDLNAGHAPGRILALTGLWKKEIRESAWYEGSAVRSSRRPGRHLFHYGIYKYLLCIRQMYMWRRNDVQKKIPIQTN